MALQISISNAIGARAVAGGGGIDPDAQAFITAASITDPTQQSAINQLVVDLKGYSIWTKMKALYPFVGGTNSQHAWNLKNTAQYKITWYGGVTSSNLGVIGNGTNGYGDSFLANNVMGQNDAHLSIYSRTNLASTVCDIGSWNGTFGSKIYSRSAGDNFEATINTSGQVQQANSDSRGFYLVTRKSSTSVTGQKNSTQYVTALNSTNNLTTSIKILRPGEYSGEYSPRNLAFASIGDGLTDAEAANFYTAVQAFQVTLGRSIGTQTVSDADAQAFVTNAGIVDQVEANAVNNLVIGLKADSLWTKMKAVYPFVGGTSTTTSYNLRNTAQYQLSWNGGWTWNSQGVTGNGSNSFANTGFNPNSAFTTNDSAHLSIYSRTNNSASAYVDFGATNGLGSSTAINSAYVNNAVSLLHNGSAGVNVANFNTQGFYIGTRSTASIHKLFKNGSQLGTTDTTSSGTRPNFILYLGAYNSNGSNLYHTNRNYAFASIGDGLSDAEATNFYNRVQTFNTALNRNV